MGIISNITKIKAQTVIGIDASTNSLAWAKFDGETPVNCGEVTFTGATVFERLKDAKIKTRALVASGVLKADYIVLEAAVMVRSIDTAISLAYVYGAILGELMEFNPVVEKYAPISWQSAIGVPNLKKAEKDKIKEDNPGKSASWYQNEGRRIRKARIMDVARNHFTIPTNSDNISDACGLALASMKQRTRRN